MIDNAYQDIMYIPLALIIAYWIYRNYKKQETKEKKFDDYYDEVLTSEKHRVKGKFESH